MSNLDKQVKLSRILSQNGNLSAICARLKMLKDSGMDNKQIEDVIKSLNLPLREHLFIMGNFSDLMDLKYRTI